ncbi:pyruvate dehydrogenase (acetyl-transferring), homodimeric type, partial [Candidatus Marinimicrobia bacterium]|nr:pyruvate dehydrogenase (acetyl-transferring), homodimeric type [Candidatus Neomarinimicrobiota bacterium]
MNNSNNKKIDLDIEETKDWLSSLEGLIKNKGLTRAKFIIDKIIDSAKRLGIDIQNTLITDYINTISVNKQIPFNGDRELERKIKSIIRWNAMAMVVRANRENPGIGGHISSFASSATLYEVGFNHFFKGPDHKDGADLIYFQGHVSPGIYSRSYLEGRISSKQLSNFRRDLKDGLTSYPHPWIMPNYWQFATVSMGLGPIQAIYQARFRNYLIDRKLIKDNNKKIWAFLGDGEMDEPESLGAINLASREGLNNLIFVINCNLQRLDGPVRGNSKIIQELEGAFQGAGWNVIKVIWGSEWDDLFANDTDNHLIESLNKMTDGELLKYVVEGGKYFRDNFWNKNEYLKKLSSNLTDEELSNLRFGGHDPAKVYTAYNNATNLSNKPTVILAQTIKGYGLGEAGEGRNITHQQKKLNEEELLEFRSYFNIPLSDEECIKAPFYRPHEDSEEIIYLQKKRKELGGYLPHRSYSCMPLNIPPLEIFQELLDGSNGREISTTMSFVRLLTIISDNKHIGDKIVPIIPDEARTFGIDPLFRKLGIYAHKGQLYEPVDSDQFLFYKEAVDGQILEEGISEAGSLSSFIAAGTAYSTYGINMIPFFIFYSMFGFQRVGDLIWAAADMRAKGFLLGGTAGKTTLAGEGLQHQDGHSHLFASTVPNLKAYDPAYAYEIAIIIQYGLKDMYEWQNNVFYYITLENENYIHPELPNYEIQEGIIKGMYCLNDSFNSKRTKLQLLASGSMVNEIYAAKQILDKDWNIDCSLWSVTSYSELHKNAEEINRWNSLHPDKPKKKSYLDKCLIEKNG